MATRNVTSTECQNYVYSTYSVCFFTGIKLNKNNRSVEHLIPQTALKGFQSRFKNINWNVVAAHKQINAAVGNAPLAIKFALKEFLKDLIIFPGLSDEKRMQTYCFAAKEFYMTYAIDGVLPWKFKSKVWKKDVSKAERKKRRIILHKAYMELITDEELRLGAYIKD